MTEASRNVLMAVNKKKMKQTSRRSSLEKKTKTGDQSLKLCKKTRKVQKNVKDFISSVEDDS